MSEKDFDFEIGDWNVNHRRLVRTLDNCQDWYEFSGTSSMHTILNGHGNVEDNLLHFPDGNVRAAAFRSYNAQTNEWSIWWLDMRNPNQLDAPVVGTFKNGRGEFIGNTKISGEVIMVRFIWTPITKNTARWEQAFSNTNGITWEINWVMDFIRV